MHESIFVAISLFASVFVAKRCVIDLALIAEFFLNDPTVYTSSEDEDSEEETDEDEEPETQEEDSGRHGLTPTAGRTQQWDSPPLRPAWPPGNEHGSPAIRPVQSQSPATRPARSPLLGPAQTAPKTQYAGTPSAATGGLLHQQFGGMAPAFGKLDLAADGAESYRHGLTPIQAVSGRHGLTPTAAAAAEGGRHGLTPKASAAPEASRHGLTPTDASAAGVFGLVVSFVGADEQGNAGQAEPVRPEDLYNLPAQFTPFGPLRGEHPPPPPPPPPRRGLTAIRCPCCAEQRLST